MKSLMFLRRMVRCGEIAKWRLLVLASGQESKRMDA